MDKHTTKVVLSAAVILGLALVVGLYILGYEQSSRNSSGLTVTGSVKKNVTSDLAKWSASFTRRSDLGNLKEVLTQIDGDKVKLKSFLTKLGLDDNSITFLPVQTNAIYEQLPGYGYTQNVIGYNVVQELRVENTDIAKVEKLGNEMKSLVGLGLVPDYQRTEYFYTKLNELRPQLYSDATADAKVRAEAIAKGTGAKVGDLLNARTGVIQITQPNSTDVSDYGTYDLSTKEKEITATVSVTFKLK